MLHSEPAVQAVAGTTKRMWVRVCSPGMAVIDIKMGCCIASGAAMLTCCCSWALDGPLWGMRPLSAACSPFPALSRRPVSGERGLDAAWSLCLNMLLALVGRLSMPGALAFVATTPVSMLPISAVGRNYKCKDNDKRRSGWNFARHARSPNVQRTRQKAFSRQHEPIQPNCIDSMHAACR